MPTTLDSQTAVENLIRDIDSFSGDALTEPLPETMHLHGAPCGRRSSLSALSPCGGPWQVRQVAPPMRWQRDCSSAWYSKLEVFGRPSAK